MKPKLTPHQKKQYSYKKECRNRYGENNKASRRLIPKRKRLANQSHRSAIHSTTATIKNTPLENVDADQLQSSIEQIATPSWRKTSDHSLQQHIHTQSLTRLSRHGRKARNLRGHR